jgi:hypothetical protein
LLISNNDAYAITVAHVTVHVFADVTVSAIANDRACDGDIADVNVPALASASLRPAPAPTSPSSPLSTSLVLNSCPC